MYKKQIKVLVLPNIEHIDSIFIGKDILVTKAYYSELEFRFTGEVVSIIHKGIDIKTYDFVWLSSYWTSRDLAYTVQLYLDYNNVAHTVVEQGTSKVSDQMVFALNKVPAPNSFFIENQEILNHIEGIEQTCAYPMIMKDIKGCAGKGAAFIRNRDELLEKVSARNVNKKYMFQSFIENEFDWGILVSDGKIVSSERSYPKDGEFRNNVGCKEVFVGTEEVPVDVQNIAIQTAKLMDLKWSRSDILLDKQNNSPYMLEINRFPGITEGSTEVTGAWEYISSTIELTNSI
jgi:glutathione synthase/RimK-type ligase-like ATP-grasp enzyme